MGLLPEKPTPDDLYTLSEDEINKKWNRYAYPRIALFIVFFVIALLGISQIPNMSEG